MKKILLAGAVLVFATGAAMAQSTSTYSGSGSSNMGSGTAPGASSNGAPERSAPTTRQARVWAMAGLGRIPARAAAARWEMVLPVAGWEVGQPPVERRAAPGERAARGADPQVLGVALLRAGGQGGHRLVVPKARFA